MDAEKVKELWKSLLLDLSCYNLDAVLKQNWELEEVIHDIIELDKELGGTKYGKQYEDFIAKEGYIARLRDNLNENR